MKPLLIGLAPSHENGLGGPLSGRIGQRLADVMGIDVDTYLLYFDRINLFPTPLRAFTDAEAWVRADVLKMQIMDRDVVVIFGRDVASAFQIETEWFEWTAFAEYGPRVAVSPHPSGRCRWWNDPMNVACAKRFWREESGGVRIHSPLLMRQVSKSTCYS